VDGHTFVSLSAGSSHVCGVTPTDSIFCWGENNEGQLGIGNTTNQSMPRLVPNSCTQVAAGEENTCALDRAGVGYCWGWNSRGQLGLGNTTSSTTPLPVSGNQTFTQFASASMTSEFMLALPLSQAFGDHVPTAPMQQFARAETDSCDTQPHDLVDFPGLSSLAHMNWGPSWAQWPNDGTGGFVCTRQPYYTNLGAWNVR
jgi:hypothetical protein